MLNLCFSLTKLHNKQYSEELGKIDRVSNKALFSIFVIDSFYIQWITLEAVYFYDIVEQSNPIVKIKRIQQIKNIALNF